MTTSPSERFTITLGGPVARDLKALALRYHNTPARLAALYTKVGITYTFVREARLYNMLPETCRAEALADLKVYEELQAAGLPEGVLTTPNPDEPAEGS